MFILHAMSMTPTKLIRYMLTSVALLSFMPTYAAEPMSDDALSNTTARGYELDTSTAADTLTFTFSDLGTHKDINGSGNLQLQRAALDSSNSNVIISDYAQSNLSALMNINSANSIIQVLLNLNININSEVGSVIQGNSSKAP